MDIKALRLKNLNALCKLNGGAAGVAKLSGTTYNTLWQTLRGTKLPSGKARAIGNDLARKIERGCGKPIGWLDQDHSAEHLSDAAVQMGLIFDALPEDQKITARRVFEAAAGYAVPDREVERKMPITDPERTKQQ